MPGKMLVGTGHRGKAGISGVPSLMMGQNSNTRISHVVKS